jgi:hypothetical protein
MYIQEHKFKLCIACANRSFSLLYIVKVENVLVITRKLTFYTGDSFLRPNAEGWQRRGDSRQQIEQATFLIQTGKALNALHGY